MKVAIIGCGSIGCRHARNASALGHGIIAYDSQAPSEALVKSTGPGVTFCASLAVAVEQRPDAAMICTPASTHAAVAKQLLEQGYRGPLFVEKPLATTLEDCEIFESWPHPTLMVGYNWRFNHDVTLWQHKWPETPTALTFRVETDLASWPGSGYADPTLECSHEQDLASAIIGPTLTFSELQAIGPNGYQLTGGTPATSVRIEVYLKSSRPGRAFFARFADGSVQTCRPSPTSIEWSYVDELQHFLACAKAHQRPDCTAMDGARVVDTIQTVRAHA